MGPGGARLGPASAGASGGRLSDRLSLTCLRGCVVDHPGRLNSHRRQRTVQDLRGRVAPAAAPARLVQQRRLAPEVAAPDDVLGGRLATEALWGRRGSEYIVMSFSKNLLTDTDRYQM